jgi:sterol 3beta-glucosyltransferase
LLTYGSRGDVEPFIALGLGLSRAGYPVRLMAPAPYRELAERRGLAFHPLDGDPERLARSFADSAGLSWPRMIARMIEFVRPVAVSVLRSVLEATADAQAIVHSFLMTEAGHTVARQRGLPDVSAQLFPVFVPTSSFPAVALPDLPLGPAYRLATHHLNTLVFRFGGRVLYRQLRAQDEGLPDLAPWPFAGDPSSRPLVLFAFSPLILPRPRDWPSGVTITGYWHLPPPDGWTPPADLSRFLESDPPPVYFGVGSMRTSRMREIVQIAMRAARSAGQRLILGMPQEAMADGAESGWVMHAEGIPHAWLFPRLRLIIHHGGAGTTGAALRAGVPSVAVPFGADQAFWARCMGRLGVGPTAPAAQRLTADRLAAVIDRALTDPAFRSRAAQVGEALRHEEGVSTAVGLIEDHLRAAR